MKEFLQFLALIGNELFDLFQYGAAGTGAPDPEYEKMLAMRIVRRVADERARREIPGP
jgi:hypothetical protein